MKSMIKQYQMASYSVGMTSPGDYCSCDMHCQNALVTLVTGAVHNDSISTSVLLRFGIVIDIDDSILRPVSISNIGDAFNKYRSQQ